MAATAFDALHPRIQSGLRELGISEPTPPQEKAMGPIFAGRSVLLVAPTASGKTEAALLPIFDSLLKEPNTAGGIEVVYVTPLRALNRDIHKRLMFWSEHLGISVQIRHGDTSQRDRRRQIASPPRFLITTPETLQAILPTKGMRGHLESVRWVVVDEIHDLASSKRGAQLTLGLERLERCVTGPLQRIGLSATVGNPEEVASFLGGVDPVEVLVVEVDKNYRYAVEFPDRLFEIRSGLAACPVRGDSLQPLGLGPPARFSRQLHTVRCNDAPLFLAPGQGAIGRLVHEVGDDLLDEPPPFGPPARVVVESVQALHGADAAPPPGVFASKMAGVQQVGFLGGQGGDHVAVAAFIFPEIVVPQLAYRFDEGAGGGKDSLPFDFAQGRPRFRGRGAIILVKQVLEVPRQGGVDGVVAAAVGGEQPHLGGAVE